MGPPGAAWVLNTPKATAEIASSRTGGHELPARRRVNPAARHAISQAQVPVTARSGAESGDAPAPTIGWFQTDMTGARQASGVPLARAPSSRIPVVTPAAVSNATQDTAKTKAPAHPRPEIEPKEIVRMRMVELEQRQRRADDESGFRAHQGGPRRSIVPVSGAVDRTPRVITRLKVNSTVAPCCLTQSRPAKSRHPSAR